MPLNQAIFRGNKAILQTIFMHCSPNPYSQDENGITPIHAASAMLDWQTF